MVPITLRIEPDVFQAIQTLAAEQKITPAEAVRYVLRVSLQQSEGQKVDLKDHGYNEGIRRGLREAKAAIIEAVDELWK